MGKIVFFIFLFILTIACNQVNRDFSTNHKYHLVDAKVKVHHSDGTRTYNEFTPFKTRTVELLEGFSVNSQIVKLSKYGGDKRYKVDSTGFFHVKKINGRWWGIDPEGYRYVNIALNSVNTKGSEGTKEAFKEKYGTKKKWINQTFDFLHKNGFNGTGSWSDHRIIIQENKHNKRPISYTINWNFMSSYGKQRGGTYQQPGHTGYPINTIFVFDPEFEIFCFDHAKQLEEFKNDPNLFGHFSDNELPFVINALDNYLLLPEDDYGRKAADKWLFKARITKEEITDQHRKEFLAFVGETYFSIVKNAIKKYDPNHMYIGARFYGNEKHQELFMTTIGKYLDVVSNNYYGYWTPDSLQMKEWTNWTGKPFLITEYYTKGEDSGMSNQSGAGWIVKTQNDRGLFYQNYCLALLESGNCVGWHYFKYQDNDPTAKDIDPSNLDANKGVISNRYIPWEPLLFKMKELNTKVYDIVDYFDKN